MDLNIGFGKDEKFVSDNVPLLKPWDIYEVTFEGAEYTTFAGKKHVDETYEVLKFKFKGEKGQFTETLFAPKDGDEIRPKRKNANGHEVESPSNLENFKVELGQILTFVAPNVLDGLRGKTANFQTMAKYIQEKSKSNIGTTVFLKLIGDKNNRARIPYFLSIFEGQKNPAITNNFISNNINTLAFTEFEIQQKEKAANAKPTEMASVNTAEDTTPDLGDINLDLL